METLATSVTRFFLQKHYIEPDQAEWFQYGLIRRMIGSLTFLLLLPIGAIFVGWIGSFLYLYSFRFLRTRTGGYHAKTPHGCLLTSLGTMFAALTLAKNLYSPLLIGAVLFAAALCIFVLAPANNASLHLTANESPPYSHELGFALLVLSSLGSLLLYICAPLASCMAVLAAGGRCHARIGKFGAWRAVMRFVGI